MVVMVVYIIITFTRFFTTKDRADCMGGLYSLTGLCTGLCTGLTFEDNLTTKIPDFSVVAVPLF